MAQSNASSDPTLPGARLPPSPPALTKPASLRTPPTPRQPTPVAAGNGENHAGGERWRRERAEKNAEPVPAASELPAQEPTEESPAHSEVEKSAPAWLISLVIHLVVLLLLALLSFPDRMGVGRLLIELGESEEGEEIEMTSFELEGPESPELLDAAEMDSWDTAVVVDAITPIEVTEMVIPVDVGTLQPQLKMSSALSGRSGSMKNALLAAHGGTKATQDAVTLGLEWLKRNQHRAGFWSLSGPYGDGSSTENKPAATAMALLAFQGDGHTHTGGVYQEQVEKGIKWLVNQQDRDGSFVTKARVPGHQSLYAQGQCMIAVCELYAMTKDSWLREPAQRAVDYAVDIQSKEGGWRYYPRRESDTSVTGWFLMGLQSAKMAGLTVPEDALSKISYYLDTVSHYEGSAYSYQPNNAPSPAMTAEGLLCRQYLGWQKDHPALVEAVLTIDEKYPFKMEERNFYYWYYATQVLHHHGGPPWRNWNNVMREELPKAQVKSGREAGSWAPQGSRWGSTGGRLYTTCLSIFCLEVYYRHMPLYGHGN